MKNKRNILIIISIFLVFIGAFLPSVRIAQENINFIKENGSLIIILVSAMFILVKLNYKQLLYIPSILSITIIIKFIIDNKERLDQINQVYNCYASYEYGIAIMLIGNILILILTTLELFNIKTIKEKTQKLKQKISEKTNIIKTKQKEKQPKKIILAQIKDKFITIKNKLLQIIKKIPTLIKKTKLNKNITHETTKDGKIKFSKITVKCDKPIKIKIPFKEKLKIVLLKIRMNSPFRKKLSISRYKEETTTYNVPVIDIQKWTRSNICCSNCGATISTNSEYCFLCDCKIKLKERKKIS